MKSGVEARPSQAAWGIELLDRVDYRLAESAPEKDAIYRMRYQAYLHAGLTAPSDSGRVSDRFDDAPNTWTFGIYVDGELCSSLRIHLLTSEWREAFSTEFYGDVLHPRLDRGEVFIDSGRFVAAPKVSQRYPELPYLTVRLAFLACEHFNANLGLAMVHPDHVPFYRRVFLQKPMAEPRPYPGWRTVTLTACDTRNDWQKIVTRFPIMRSSAFERRMLFQRAGAPNAFPRGVVAPSERLSIVPSS